MVRKTKVAAGAITGLMLLTGVGCLGGYDFDSYHRSAAVADAPMVLRRVGPLLLAVKWSFRPPDKQRFPLEFDLVLATNDGRQHQFLLTEVVFASVGLRFANEVPQDHQLREVTREASCVRLSFRVMDLERLAAGNPRLLLAGQIDGNRFEEVIELANCFKAEP